MRFEGVLPELKQGKRIRQASAKDPNCFWMLDKISNRVYNQKGELIVKDINNTEVLNAFDEVRAGNDWEVVKETTAGQVLYEAYWEAHQQYSKLMDNNYRYLAPVPYGDLDVNYSQVWEKAAQAVIDTNGATQ